ncbi:zinc ribbon domain-containing protein [Photorhabdus luminescens]|nr:zinc ribbon domain-containing protein [Photorhabdus luminescens]
MSSESLFKKCKACGKDVSKTAKSCPGCGAKMKKANFIKIFVLCIAILILIKIIASWNEDDGKLQPDTASDTKTVVKKHEATIPSDQTKFVQIVSSFVDKYASAKNELQKSSLREQRRVALADAFTQNSVNSWIGTITELKTNNDGKAILSVKVSPNIELATWNNEFSDIRSDTLIEKDSTVYDELFSLSVGQKIEFSGYFFSSSIDFFEEKSLTTDGSMKNPEFLFKFFSVKTVN